MKGYSTEFNMEEFATARLEGVDASYKDLSEVCGRIRRKDAAWARTFLELAAAGEIPILYKRHNKKLGHRRELGGKKGRYPWKAAKIVLKLLNSAVANGLAKGLGEGYVILSAVANKKFSYPRMAPKGRTARSYYELSRIEIVLKPTESVPKGVEFKAPGKQEKKEEKKEEKKVEKNEAKKAEAPKHEPHPHVHKHEVEKELAAQHARHEKYAFEQSKGRKTEVKKEG